MLSSVSKKHSNDESRPLLSNSNDHNVSSSSQTNTLTLQKTTSHSQTHIHRPHHMKYGDEIRTSGFAPGLDSSDEEEIAHFRAACGIIDVDEYRRKMRRDKAREVLDAEARRIHSSRRYLVRKPRPLQYFRGKTLVRSDEERSSGRLELFFDLTFVGLIAVLAKEVAEEPTWYVLLRYLITYTQGLLVWTWMRELFNSFYKDDILQRFLVMFVIACLIVFGNNAPRVDQDLSEGPARAATVVAYLLAEAAVFGNFLFHSYHIKAYRLQLRAHTLAWAAAACIWITTIFVRRNIAIILAVIAVCVEYGAWGFVYSPTFKILMRLRYSSAINIEHEVERFNDFFTLVMGEFLFSVFAGSPAGIGFHASGGRAVLAVMIAFAFQMFYILGSSAKKITHPLRRSGPYALGFFSIHLPLVSALTLCGDIMAEFVKDKHVSSSLKWFVCESYAVGMISLWALANLERDRDSPGEVWFSKSARLLPRLISGTIAIFLPLSPVVRNEMSTTKLLGILTALSAFALLWEQIASLDGPHAPYECAPDDMMAAATHAHPTRAALQTPKWKGYPTCVEPGTGTIDRSHQTYRRNTELAPEIDSEQL